MSTNPLSLPPYTIRAIRPADRDALAGFYGGLCTDSIEARFHAALAALSDVAVRGFCGPDHRHREGLIAEHVRPDGQAEIIGHVCLEPVGDGRRPHAELEVGVAVADAWQHHGVGRALLAAAAGWARARGTTVLRAQVRCGNGAMLGLARSLGYPIAVTGAPGDAILLRIQLDELSRPAA